MHADVDDLVLVLDVGGRRCALRAADVVEVHRAAWVDPLPRAPAIVMGVIDVRGEILPVVDLHRRFGLPSKPMDLHDHLVVVQGRTRRMALHVGRHVDLVPALAADLDHAVDVAPYARGAARLTDGLVVIHDVDAFLTPAEHSLLDEALAGVEEPAR